MGGQAQQDLGCDTAGKCVIGTLCCLLAAVIIIVPIVLACMSTDPVYSATITGVAGLDPTVNPARSLTPVFNLTVRIDNSGQRLTDEACIGRLSTVSVSYHDAPLARGSMPPAEFCAEAGKVVERGVMAWGKGVDLPQFLLDQLAGELAAGEAAVDVKVTTPAERSGFGDKVYVCSQVKIVGGPATCQKEIVYNQHQANPDSTYIPNIRVE